MASPLRFDQSTEPQLNKSGEAVRAVLAEADPNLPSAAVVAASMACMCALCDQTMTNVPTAAQNVDFYTALANDAHFDAMAAKMIGKAFKKVDAMAAASPAIAATGASLSNMGKPNETLRTARAAKALMTDTFARVAHRDTRAPAPSGTTLNSISGRMRSLSRSTSRGVVGVAGAGGTKSIVESVFQRRGRGL